MTLPFMLTDALRPATRDADWQAVWQFFETWNGVHLPEPDWQPELPDPPATLPNDVAHPVRQFLRLIHHLQATGKGSVLRDEPALIPVPGHDALALMVQCDLNRS